MESQMNLCKYLKSEFTQENVQTLCLLVSSELSLAAFFFSSSCINKRPTSPRSQE